MRITYKVKHGHAIRLKFGDTYLYSLKRKPVSALQSKKICFYIIASYQQIGNVVINLTYLNNKICHTKKHLL